MKIVKCNVAECPHNNKALGHCKNPKDLRTCYAVMHSKEKK